MIEIATIEAMRAWSRARRREGKRIGFVPTMGFLHEGHLRLVDRAREAADAVVLSIFVNPTQFGPKEDFSRYPRDLPRDRAAAESRAVDCLFAPTPEEMYPQSGEITMTPGHLADHLCGPRRPGHFAGVLTVVAKLLHIVEPDVAVFGRKDVQQAHLIRRMVEDLDFPVSVDVAPTIREHDGLALSSRNVYLDGDARRAATSLVRALEAGHQCFAAGERTADAILHAARDVLATEPAAEVEYVELVDPTELAPVATADPRAILALAVRIGGTRLIDNIALGDSPADDPRLHV